MKYLHLYTTSVIELIDYFVINSQSEEYIEKLNILIEQMRIILKKVSAFGAVFLNSYLKFNKRIFKFYKNLEIKIGMLNEMINTVLILFIYFYLKNNNLNL